VWIFLTQLAIKQLFSFSPHPMFAYALPRECRPSEICVEICKNAKKTSPTLSIITWSDFNNFWSKYCWHHWLLYDCSSSHLTQLLLLHYLGKQIMCWNKWKNFNIFYLPNLWPLTGSRLQGLTVVEQCVYQITFKNVYEFKKWLVKSGLVWSRTLCCQWMRKASLWLCSHNVPTFQAILL